MTAVAVTRVPPTLWTRDFTLYFGARVVSLLGDAMMPVAAALAVGALYGVSGVGYVLAVWTAPFVLFGKFEYAAGAPVRSIAPTHTAFAAAVSSGMRATARMSAATLRTSSNRSRS